MLSFDELSKKMSGEGEAADLISPIEFRLINPSAQDITSQNYQTLYQYYIQEKSLKTFTLMSAPYIAITKEFFACLRESLLIELNLTCSFLDVETHNKILAILAAHPTLKEVRLNQTALSSKSVAALANFIRKNQNLEFLDISDNYFTAEDEAILIEAINDSSRLVTVKGIKNNELIEEHLSTNEAFKLLEMQIDEKKFKEIKDSVELDIKRKTAYKTIETIRKHLHDKKRLNELMSRLFLLLAKEYQLLGDQDNARHYYKKLFADKKNKALQGKAHHAYGEYLYMQFSNALNTEPASLSGVAAPASSTSTSILTLPRAALLQGFKALEHLEKALLYTEGDEHSQTKKLLAQVAVSLGERFLDEAEKINADDMGFQRKYQKTCKK